MSGNALPGTVATEVGRYDDEALVHLANKGLVRRATKLLEKPHEVYPDSGTGAVVVTGDGWEVRFEADDPLSQGGCGCPTAGVCQHLVAAIMALRAAAGSVSDGDGNGGDTSPGVDTPSGDRSGTTGDQDIEGWSPIQDALLTLSDDELLRWTRKADGRWARDRAAGLDISQVVIDRGANLGVDLPPPHGAVRFLGPTLEAAVVKPSTRHDRRVVGLAVLALWMTVGRDVAPAADDTVPATELPAERAAVTARAQQLAANLVRVGLLHVGEREQEQLDSLAASARGAKLYRLSLLAERASDHVVAITELSPQGDTQTLLGQLAEINTVAESIDRALGSGAALADGLVGQARARFENVGQLDLAAVGHYTWGDQRFAGSTGVLLDRSASAASRAYTVSKPRVVSGRHLGDIIGWSGTGSVSALSGRRVTLANVKASEELRLSTSESVAASVGPELAKVDFDALAWDGTAPPPGSRLLARRGSAWTVCPVDDFDASTEFDPITQQLRWRFVSQGQAITAAIPYRPASALAVTNLERLVAQASITHVVGRLGRAHGTADNDLSIWPISVFTDRLVVLSDDAVEQDKRSWLSSLVMGRGEAADDGAADVPPPPTMSAADQISVKVQRQAERGEHPSSAADLQSLAHTARMWGLGVLSDVMTGGSSVPQAILRAAWTLQLLADTQAEGQP